MLIFILQLLMFIPIIIIEIKTEDANSRESILNGLKSGFCVVSIPAISFLLYEPDVKFIYSIFAMYIFASAIYMVIYKIQSGTY